VHRPYENIRLTIAILLVCCTGVFAQQDQRSSLAMYCQAITNPAVAGSSEQADLYALARQSLLTFKDANGNSVGNASYTAAFVLPFKKINSGVGLSAQQETNGLFETNLNISLMYAYQFQIGEGKLGVGGSGTFKKYKYDFSKAVYPSGIGSSSGGGQDDYIDQLGKIKSNTIGVGAGVYYKINELYFGVSVTNVNSPKFKLESAKAKYFIPHSYITAGYTLNTNNPSFTLYPSMVFKSALSNTSLAGSQLNLNLIVEYHKFLLFGLEYTTSNDITAIAGVNFKDGSKFDGVRFVASWDVVTSKLRSYTIGNLEFTLGYTFNMAIEKTAKTYKSVRFL